MNKPSKSSSITKISCFIRKIIVKIVNKYLICKNVEISWFSSKFIGKLKYDISHYKSNQEFVENHLRFEDLLLTFLKYL